MLGIANSRWTINNHLMFYHLGNITENRKKWKKQYTFYSIASGVASKSVKVQSAVFFTCNAIWSTRENLRICPDWSTIGEQEEQTYGNNIVCQSEMKVQRDVYFFKNTDRKLMFRWIFNSGSLDYKVQSNIL